MTGRAAALAAAMALAGLQLAGCGSGEGSGSGVGSQTPRPSPSGETALTITVDSGEKKRTFRLTCNPPGGTHPAAEAACDYLAAASTEGRDPFVPVPKDRACTMIYGGPQRATVKGTWDGTVVDAKFSRTNGCELERWEDAVPLLLLDPGADEPSPSPPPR